VIDLILALSGKCAYSFTCQAVVRYRFAPTETEIRSTFRCSNTKKTVCIICSPKCRNKIVVNEFDDEMSKDGKAKSVIAMAYYFWRLMQRDGSA